MNKIGGLSTPLFMRFLSRIFSSVVIASLAVACGPRYNPMAEVMDDDEGLVDADLGEYVEGLGIEKEEGSGPSMLGPEYYVRTTYSVLNAEYRDVQKDDQTGREDSLANMRLQGGRVTLEHYPLLLDRYPDPQYGFLMVEGRREKPDDFPAWKQRDTFVALMGYVLPWFPLTIPVVGVHGEFNDVDLTRADSPQVVKSDVRAFVVGTHLRNKIWGYGSSFATYGLLRFHLINVGLPDSGHEVEAGLGFTLNLYPFRADLSLGMLDHRYRAWQEVSTLIKERIQIESWYRARWLGITIWY